MSPMRAIHVLLFTLAFTPFAAAQSVDCKLAQSPREHAVCDVPRLSALDTQIAAAYKSLREQLSPQSAALVESDEREWLQWIDLVCPGQGKVAANPGSPASPHAEEEAFSHCLQDHYAARARDFKKTTHLGTAIIFSRAHFLYKPAGQLSRLPAPEYPGFGYGSLRWPQIDRKSDRKSANLTPAEAAWNAAVKTHAAKLGAGVFNAEQNLTFDTAVNALEDIDADYNLDAANDRLIEVSLIVSSYVWVSGASPLTIRSSFLWWLDRNRELATDDVFPPLSAWQAYLVSVASGGLQANPRLTPLLREDPQLAGAVEQSVPKTSNWTLTKNGLTITFLRGMVAANTVGMPHVFISWEDLKPFLEPTLNTATLPTRLPKPTP
jgi:uncharacterized protein YecT (DUF1311 family)